jgi:hypothetical protein
MRLPQPAPPDRRSVLRPQRLFLLHVDPRRLEQLLREKVGTNAERITTIS